MDWSVEVQFPVEAREFSFPYPSDLLRSLSNLISKWVPRALSLAGK
jgi:hypothetical protein